MGTGTGRLTGADRLRGEHFTGQAVPHPCQNGPVLTVIDGHSGDVHRHDDLGSGRYQCRPNKPDKEEVRGSSPRSPTSKYVIQDRQWP
jgi:hypothetical protein